MTNQLLLLLLRGGGVDRCNDGRCPFRRWGGGGSRILWMKVEDEYIGSRRESRGVTRVSMGRCRECAGAGADQYVWRRPRSLQQTWRRTAWTTWTTWRRSMWKRCIKWRVVGGEFLECGRERTPGALAPLHRLLFWRHFRRSQKIIIKKKPSSSSKRIPGTYTHKSKPWLLNITHTHRHKR